MSKDHYVINVNIKHVTYETQYTGIGKPSGTKTERVVDDILSVVQTSDSLTEAVDDIANHMYVVRNRNRSEVTKNG